MSGNIISDLPSPAAPPGVDFTWSPGGAVSDPTYGYPNGRDSGAHRCLVGTPVTFTAVFGLTSGVTPVSYEWDFGDGTIAHGQVVQHTFGFFNPHLRVTMRMTDSNGRLQSVGHQMMLYTS